MASYQYRTLRPGLVLATAAEPPPWLERIAREGALKLAAEQQGERKKKKKNNPENILPGLHFFTAGNAFAAAHNSADFAPAGVQLCAAGVFG